MSSRILRPRGLLQQRAWRPPLSVPVPPDPPEPEIPVVAEDVAAFNAATRQADVVSWIEANMPASAVPVEVTPGTSSGNANQPATEILAYSVGNPSNPTVMLQACIHGSEMMATHALVEFVNRVANPTGPNAAMYAEIASKLHLAVIPCLSPAAYQPALASFPNGTYKAPGHHQEAPWYPHEGTNPNRNYPWRWDNYAVDTPTSPSYKGQAAADLPEVQASIDLFTQFSPFAAVDMHTYSAIELPRWGIDRNATSHAGHYEEWSAQRQAEMNAILPDTENSQMNVTNAPTATGWASQQLAPDGAPVFGQIVEVGAPTTSGTRLQDMGSMSLTLLLVLCRAWIAAADDRGYYA